MMHYVAAICAAAIAVAIALTCPWWLFLGAVVAAVLHHN